MNDGFGVDVPLPDRPTSTTGTTMATAPTTTMATTATSHSMPMTTWPMRNLGPWPMCTSSLSLSLLLILSVSFQRDRMVF
jgi:hypothetical protein